MTSLALYRAWARVAERTGNRMGLGNVGSVTMSSRTVSTDRFKYAAMLRVSHKSIATGSGTVAGFDRCSSNFSNSSSVLIFVYLVGTVRLLLCYGRAALLDDISTQPLAGHGIDPAKPERMN